MASQRKLLSTQKGHLKRDFIEQRKLEEESVYTGCELLNESKPPAELINAVARKKWKEVVHVLTPIKIISDADISNVIGFCNAWAKYCEAIKLMKHVIDSETKAEAETKMLKFGKEFRDFGGKIGLDQSSRLKAAASKTQKQEEKIEEMFGAI